MVFIKRHKKLKYMDFLCSIDNKILGWKKQGRNMPKYMYLADGIIIFFFIFYELVFFLYLFFPSERCLPEDFEVLK